LGRGCGHRKAEAEAEAEGLYEAGHGTRRARYVAGSNGGAEAAVDELGFGCVDVSGAVLRPEAVTNSAGAEDFAFVVADGTWGWFRSEYYQVCRIPSVNLEI
jgi:hypothetical protein